MQIIFDSQTGVVEIYTNHSNFLKELKLFIFYSNYQAPICFLKYVCVLVRSTGMKNSSGSAALKRIRHQLYSGWGGIKFCVKSALSRARSGDRREGGCKGGGGEGARARQHEHVPT